MEPREDEFGYYESAAPSGKFFRDRADAGAQLAAELLAYRGPETLVLGIPRGGVPVAYQIAKRLDAQLDVIVARKIGAPGHEELAIGAVTADGTTYVNSRIRRLARVSDTVFEHLKRAELEVAQRREQRFRAGLPGLFPVGRTVIVVDDGLATGATMYAAVKSLRARGAERVILAVPVGSQDACRALEREVDALVCLHRPEPFYAVGLYYQTFDQTPDEQVELLLHKRREEHAARHGKQSS